MKTEILKALKAEDGFLSGQELCERFGVSRTAVWKAINQLKAEGYQIEAVRNRGYFLNRESDVLSEEELSGCIRTAWAGRNVRCFERTDSTNIRARKLAEEGASHGTLVLAERQDLGKGRRGRHWESPAGSGIWMSILLRPQIKSVSASMLTLLMALAASEGIRRATGIESQIKWPNDLVLNKKKICGILTEMNTELMEIQYVVIGAGINVNQTEFPEELRETATSLFLESGKRWKRSEIVAGTVAALEEYYEVFARTEDMSALLEKYNGCLVNLGREVTILDPAGAYRGISEGIKKDGSLLVRMEDGTLREVISGEVSVRGVYGYV